VKILRVDPDERKIGLSRKRVEWAEKAEAETGRAEAPTAGGSTVELKGGVGDSSGPLIKPIPVEEDQPSEVQPEAAAEQQATGGQAGSGPAGAGEETQSTESEHSAADPGAQAEEPEESAGQESA